MTTTMIPLRGVYPILATCFHEDESIDFESQERLIDYCIAEGVQGLVTLANASEGHLLTGEERKDLLSFVLKKVRGRVPVVVTVNHPSCHGAADMARYAEAAGASAVMCMPPFFGRWRSAPGEVAAFFTAVDGAVHIPVILQDHQLSDIPLGVDFIISLAEKCDNLRYVKLEYGNIIHKARALLAHPGCPLNGVFGGNSGVFLPEEHQAGCCGTMPACYMPEVFRQTWSLLEAGRGKEAVNFYAPFSRLAAYEKDVANRCLWKVILVRKGVIRSARTRGPEPAFFGQWEVDQLLAVARQAGLQWEN